MGIDIGKLATNGDGRDVVRLCEQQRASTKARGVQAALPMAQEPTLDLPDRWCWASLSSLCSRVSVGHVGPTSEFFCPPDKGVKFIRSQDVRPGRLDLDNCRWITEDFHTTLKKSQLRPGDVLVVRVGANRGDSCVVPNEVTDLNCANIVFARPMIPGAYLGYFLRSPLGQRLLLSVTTGSAQGVLNTKSIASLPVLVPPLPIQRRIASILSAYDDLIENNTKRIKILEEMARALYREWFVHFRFPGHEKVELVDSPLGQIPEGWKVSTIGNETTKIGSGATPRGGREAYKESGITLIRSLNIYDYRFDDDGLAFINEDQAAKLDNVVVEARDVLLNITGASVARCCMARERHLPARVNQHVAIIRADTDRVDPYYLLCSINNDEQKRQLLAFAQGGATREALTKGTIQNFPLLVPERSILRRFGESAGAFLRQREVLEQMNIVLRQTRDLLLPRLISGDLDVSTLPLP